LQQQQFQFQFQFQAIPKFTAPLPINIRPFVPSIIDIHIRHHIHHHHHHHQQAAMATTPSRPTKLNTSSLPTNLASTSSATTSPTADKPGSGSSSSATVLPADLHGQLTALLLANNSIPRIEAALAHELAASGFTANLRAYVTQLVRSGEAGSFADLVRAVNGRVRVGGKDANGDSSKGAGAEAGVAAGLAIPQSVVKEGVRAVRRELDTVVDLRVDDVVD
jgi:hypothetical protein